MSFEFGRAWFICLTANQLLMGYLMTKFDRNNLHAVT